MTDLAIDPVTEMSSPGKMVLTGGELNTHYIAGVNPTATIMYDLINEGAAITIHSNLASRRVGGTNRFGELYVSAGKIVWTGGEFRPGLCNDIVVLNNDVLRCSGTFTIGQGAAIAPRVYDANGNSIPTPNAAGWVPGVIFPILASGTGISQVPNNAFPTIPDAYKIEPGNAPIMTWFIRPKPAE